MLQNCRRDGLITTMVMKVIRSSNGNGFGHGCVFLFEARLFDHAIVRMSKAVGAHRQQFEEVMVDVSHIRSDHK